MNQNDDHIRKEDADPSRTLETGKPLYEIGSRIGGYKLLSVLGEGGFGMVYLAEQEHPIKRLVALKVIKPGMDTKQVIARFETERQALAMLDHPNIARVFDAGATEAGRPYFAMEYVKGIPITVYCDRYKLGMHERLRLFIPLCQAIQHAHHKGIIHRDIKPSNALVMLHDEQPIPKIIDFGVAKALNQRLTERTLVTEQGQLIGTPEYMSPEQAEVTILDVDTRTDIYSLGVLLYELLTGCTPFDPGELRGKGYGEMQRIIREQDPVKPSTKLMIQGDKLQEIARQRGTAADQLRKAVRGDLDWIVMKCLEKDRARRYGTALALAEDVERYLNHLPVRAGSPGVLYRARKFLRRHRTEAAVGGFLFAVVVLSAAVIGQYERGKERLLAVQRESRAREEALALENARSSLSTAQADYASGRYAEALQTLRTLVDNPYVGAQARLLRARLALDQPDVNVPLAELQALLQEPNEIACQAHLLLANLYLESRADDDKTARELVRKATEHRQKARSLASNSADACFGSALLSDTPAERMELLNQALVLNPGHINSLRIRALTHYTSRNYDDMELDAYALTVVAKDRPEGHALRAIALREKAQLRGRKELLSQAVAEHTRAIELAPAQPRFYDERRETYMRLGEYEKALADARECIRLSPEEGLYHFHAFCALTALGRYAEAQREYETIVLARGGSSTGDYPFHRWVAAYALDIVERHASWHPADPVPEGVAFAILRQTVEAHEALAQKAQCVVHEGYTPTWSPNGEELAYSRGPVGYSAVEILNLKTGTTRLLCYTGFDPVWSPDGRWIAFVRHRRTVRPQDLAEGKKVYAPALEDFEIWIANAQGAGKPSMLVRGICPSWSGDARRLYYHSLEEDGYLCSISIASTNATPVRGIRMLGLFPMVSPDEKYVVWNVPSPTGPDPIELVERQSGKVLARWLGCFPNWSPDGKGIIFSRYGGRDNGTWVYDLEKGKAAKVVDGWVCRRCSWAPDTGQVALSLYAQSPPAYRAQSPQVGEYVYSGAFASIWVAPLERHIWASDSSALVRDWPADESDARRLCQMIEGYRTFPERMAVAEELRHRLVEVLQQAVASGAADSIQPVQQLADVYLWLDRYDDAEQLYLQARDRQRAKYGAKAESYLDLTEELVRFYLDVLNRHRQAEQLCLELSQARQDVLGANHPCVLRTLILLARIYERQKRYPEAERIYLDILNRKSDEDVQDSASGVYESVFWRWPFAPLNCFLDEQALAVRLLEDPSAGAVRDKRWTICAHYLLTRLYTTCPTAEFHDPARAIEHGTLACELGGGAEPICLDALAAAYAEAERWDLAVQRQKAAVVHLSGNKTVMRTIFVNRLAKYEQGVSEFPKGLVARWEFEPGNEGMAADTSGNNLHGRLVGDARVYADPERGNVLRLDGEGDCVDCGADARFDMTDEIAVSVWIKVGTFDKAWQAIIAKGSNTWRLQRARASNVLEFSYTGVDAREPWTFYVEGLRGNVDVDDARWHHVVGVYDGRRLSLYVDGRLDTSAPPVTFSRINTSKDHVLIGMNTRSRLRSREWNGLIDDLRIYNYALRPEDVKALYEGREPPSDQESTKP